MLVFECPSCKTKLQVADEHAGKTIACPKCKTKATVPKQNEPEVEVTIVEPDAVTARPAKSATSNKARDSEDRDEGEDARYEDEEQEDRPRRRRKSSSGAAVGIAGMGIGSILLIGGGILSCCICLGCFPLGISKVRQAAARTQSTNNLKNIGLSFHGFHDANTRLPFNGTKAADRK